MKHLKSILAFFLSVTLLFQTSTVVFASGDQVYDGSLSADVQQDSASGDLSLETDISSAEVVSEIEEQRTAFTKEFLLSNGLHMAVSYPEQVHYESDGVWKEIDNTLKAKDGTYVNTAGVFLASLPKTLTKESVITMQAGDYEVSFRLLSSSRGGLFDGEQETSEAKIVEKEKTDVTFHPERLPEKLSSRLTYENIFLGTDLIYDLNSAGIKEYIVFETADDTASFFTFELYTGDLSASLLESGEIVLYQEKEDSPEFRLPAPYLIDSANETSTGVKVSLSPAKGGEENSYLLTYELPMDWLNAEERMYPVALDPAIQTEQVRDLPVPLCSL